MWSREHAQRHSSRNAADLACYIQWQILGLWCIQGCCSGFLLRIVCVWVAPRRQRILWCWIAEDWGRKSFWKSVFKIQCELKQNCGVSEGILHVTTNSCTHSHVCTCLDGHKHIVVVPPCCGRVCLENNNMRSLVHCSLQSLWRACWCDHSRRVLIRVPRVKYTDREPKCSLEQKSFVYSLPTSSHVGRLIRWLPSVMRQFEGIGLATLGALGR